MPIRTKTDRDVTQAFEQILAEQKCNMVQGDKGAEFMNSTFQLMLRGRGIKFYCSKNEDIKTALVERISRTLKKMFRYFTQENTGRYVDVLPDLVHSYNNTHHRSIGMAPAEVNMDNEDVVRNRLYPEKPKSYKWKYNVGDSVRISMQCQPFRKGYLGEIFEIKSASANDARDVRAERFSRRAYKREILRVGNSAGVKV